MFIDQLTNADSMPVLRAVAQFAGRRQQVLLANIANISTPGYQMKDVSVSGFQGALAEAIAARREKNGGSRGDLEIKSTSQLEFTRDGLRVVPGIGGDNVMFHDRNNRDLERAMQDLSENVAMFRLATDLLRSKASLLEAAIRERS